MNATTRFRSGLRTSRKRYRTTPRTASRFDFGALAGLVPVTSDWGYSRGQPVDRIYIERFLAQYKQDIRGHVLEIGDDTYTSLFGEGRATKITVADVVPANPKATLIADLTDASNIPSDAYDCVILTQVLGLIRDFGSAMANVARILRHDGVALLTVPGISPISADPREAELWSWSFYPETLRHILEIYFDPSQLAIESYGNVKTAIGFLAGLAQEDLSSGDFQYNDPRYPVVVAGRAVKNRPAF